MINTSLTLTDDLILEIDTGFPRAGVENDVTEFHDNYLRIVSNLDAARTDLGNILDDVIDLDGAVTSLTEAGGTVATINSRIDDVEDQVNPLIAPGGRLDTIEGDVTSLQDDVVILNDNAVLINQSNDLNGNTLSDFHMINVSHEPVQVSSGSTSLPMNGGYYVKATNPNSATVEYTFTGFKTGKYVETQVEITGGPQSSTVTFAGSTLTSDLPSPFTVATGERHVLKVWSADGGGEVFIKYIGNFA